MTLSDLGSVGSAAVSFLALIVAVLSLHKTNKFNDRQNDLAETTEQLNRHRTGYVRRCRVQKS
jgi:hypothetical protein